MILYKISHNIQHETKYYEENNVWSSSFSNAKLYANQYILSNSDEDHSWTIEIEKIIISDKIPKKKLVLAALNNYVFALNFVENQELVWSRTIHPKAT